ncbi:hypothetical protein R5W24_000857 [Gemmata sp. JC717]|uniref:hypothetical protein n=1 Tax=Gemmata algarum TaxID=2975278 RepID=UPI0021BB7C7D|nr:hypothetical protein [Gemmata algarum]MDY3551778.1 hypothetical protein [Gemmata algarum]
MRRTLFALLVSGAFGSIVLAQKTEPVAPGTQKDTLKRDKALESKDEAKRFGEAAWARLAPAAERLFKEKGIDFVVETAPYPPKGDPNKIAAMRPAEREKFFKEFTDARAKELNLKGVHVFVSKKPETLYVHVSEAADLPKGFGPKLKAALIASFREQKFDEGLNKAIDMTLDAKGLGEKK